MVTMRMLPLKRAGARLDRAPAARRRGGGGARAGRLGGRDRLGVAALRSSGRCRRRGCPRRPGRRRRGVSSQSPPPKRAEKPSPSWSVSAARRAEQRRAAPARRRSTASNAGDAFGQPRARRSAGRRPPRRRSRSAARAERRRAGARAAPRPAATRTRTGRAPRPSTTASAERVERSEVEHPPVGARQREHERQHRRRRQRRAAGARSRPARAGGAGRAASRRSERQRRERRPPRPGSAPIATRPAAAMVASFWLCHLADEQLLPGGGDDRDHQHADQRGEDAGRDRAVALGVVAQRTPAGGRAASMARDRPARPPRPQTIAAAP